MHLAAAPFIEGSGNCGRVFHRECREIAYFGMHLAANLNFDSPYISAGITYRHVVLEMEPNPIRTAINVCKHLIARQVLAIIVSHSSAGELSPAAVSYTCGFYHIPVIGISSRDSAFSDKVTVSKSKILKN
ncbi:hypothetical protein TKK_0011091 [Trichogramma kaykai]